MCTKLQFVKLYVNYYYYLIFIPIIGIAKILHFRLQKKKIISSYKNKRILLEKLKQRLRLSTLAIRTYDRNILQ